MPIVPKNLAPLFEKAGRNWTPKERRHVIEWVSTEPQLQYFLKFALLFLRTYEDAENAWQEFCITNLSKTIDSFDPEKGSFDTWVRLRLKQHCHKMRNIGAAEKTELVDPIDLELVVADPRPNPHEAWEQRDRETEQERLRIALQDCINKLPRKYALVVLLFYFKGKSLARTAEIITRIARWYSFKALGFRSHLVAVNENHVKQLLYRARQELEKCLRDFGRS